MSALGLAAEVFVLPDGRRVCLALKRPVRLEADRIEGACLERGLDGAAGLALVPAVAKTAPLGELEDVPKGPIDVGVDEPHFADPGHVDENASEG